MTTTIETTTSSPAHLLRERATTTPDKVALREKDRGLWREITWGEYWDQVETFAHALLAHGVERGDRIAIHSENRPEWIAALWGCLLQGIVAVPITGVSDVVITIVANTISLTPGTSVIDLRRQRNL